ncbi:MAG: hypothetical protein LBQ49_00095 [Rickettsiales bacterium]|jgi:opacity protein-like surface antigen|nr:hypothetical protein [Rickettsiales bacterium]
MKKLFLSSLFVFNFSLLQAGMIVDFYVGGVASVGNNIAFSVPAEGNIKKSANSFGAVAGVDLPIIRVEGEYGFLTSKTIDLHVGMVNGYIKLFPTPIVKPYIGLGVGRVLGGSVDGGADINSAMGYQAMAGLQFSIPMTPLFFDIEGRVFYADDVATVSIPPLAEKDIGFAQYDIRGKIRIAF